MPIFPRAVEAALGRRAKLITIDANGVMALDKPAGMLSHPNENGKTTPSSILFKGLYDTKGEFYTISIKSDNIMNRQKLWLLNRLDYATSGVILASSSKSLSTIIKEQFKIRQVSKVYYAKVFGNSSYHRSDHMMEWIDSMVGREMKLSEAITHVRILEENQKEHTLLLELKPTTGFKHQLRYQCAKRGFPIVGDRMYGDYSLNKSLLKERPINRLLLHCHSVEFSYSYNNNLYHFQAQSPVPEEFTT